jgi:hypothetical protein
MVGALPWAGQVFNQRVRLANFTGAYCNLTGREQVDGHKRTLGAIGKCKLKHTCQNQNAHNLALKCALEQCFQMHFIFTVHDKNSCLILQNKKAPIEALGLLT